MFPRLYQAAALSCLLALFGGCQGILPPPHFAFKKADLEWLQAREGDEWIFENPRGRQMRFRLADVMTRHKVARKDVGLLGDKLMYYFDDHYFKVVRTDSTTWANSFHFYSHEPDGERKTPQGLFASASWQNIIGSVDAAGSTRCQQLCFVGHVRELPATSLTIRGRRYEHVLTFTATPAVISSCSRSALRPLISQVWYDRRHGVVQMQGLNGELWERLP